MTFKVKAFTLIELLIVIAIIGILSSVVLVSVSAAKLKAKQAKAAVELKQMSTFMQMAQRENGRTLREITNSTCSDCVCRNGVDMTTVSTGHPCYIRWRAARTAIAAEIGQGPSAFSSPVTDPWGSPYGLDENEGEYFSDVCRNDRLRSFGPDGLFNTDDDIAIFIPFSGRYNCL